MGSLAELNKRLDTIFKKFNIDGGAFEFRGFDRGTNWYEIYITGFVSFNFFIACLKVAQEYLKAKTEYFNSEKARLDYQASLKDKDDIDEKELKKFTERRLELEIEKKVNDAINNIKEKNGKSEEEIKSQLIIATKGLIKELGEGVEFHLSLNPPEYTKEIGGELKIDYVKINEINAENSKPKQLKDDSDIGEGLSIKEE